MKKRIISAILSVILAVAAVPVDSVNASEIIGSEGENEAAAGTAEQETIEGISETEATETLASEDMENESADAGSITESVETIAETTKKADTFFNEYNICSIDEADKVIGSNGVAYEEITYLSADAVRSMDDNARKGYIQICDELASWIEGGYTLDSAVIALDSDGDINWYWSVPAMEISRIQGEMIRETVLGAENQTETEGLTEPETEESAETETAALTEPETEVLTEEQTEPKTEAETETLTEEGTEEQTETQIQTEPETEESAETETAVLTEPETEVLTEGQNETQIETLTEEETGEQTETEMAAYLDEVSLEMSAAAGMEAGDPVLAENMEVMPEITEDSYEVAEDVPVDVFIGLGYDQDYSGINAKLPSGSYFYNQLQGIEKTVFDAGKSTLTAGKTSISFSGAPTYSTTPICQGISALILTYSDKFDWMDLSSNGGMSCRAVIRGASASYTLSIKKSPYYSSSLEKSAKERVKQLATAAQNYAQKNYPQAPAYGVVKYFDSWICANNYYNNIGVTGGSASDKATQEAYYYCHSSYGILLKGYGVCESYALSMSRLLDSVGIKNMYVTGDAGGGHAWNFVQMPDKNWYLQDSTWNDAGGGSNTIYLLTNDDGRHLPIGNRFSRYSRKFNFATLSGAKYVPVKKSLSFDKSSYDLTAKKTVKLSCGNDDMAAAKKKWTSSNTKVARVSSNGTVTAVAPGTATITLTGTLYGVEMKAACTVNVHQVKGMAFSDSNKTSSTLSCGIDGDTGKSSEAQTLMINVNCGDSKYNAQQMIEKGWYAQPEVKVSNPKVAAAQYSLKGNCISLKIQPVVAGSAKVTVKFAGKTITLNCNVGRKIKAEWFDTSEIPGTVEYTGKSYTPKIVKKDSAPKGITYKVMHTNNKNAGTAAVTISGTGKYGGGLSYTYKITPVNITEADFASCTKSKVYNGAPLKAAATVKLKNKRLSEGKDYNVIYSGMRSVTGVGKYTVTIQGKGNYTGTVKETKEFEITANNIKKMTVTCPSKVKYTGGIQNPIVVKIGKNVLPSSDYSVVYHADTESGAVTTPKDKGKYVAVITPKGNNVTTAGKKTTIVKKFTIK